MSQKNYLKIYEAYVLRILSIQFILSGVLYLFYSYWVIGIFLIIISVLFGTIGQSLKHNRQRSANDLLRGQDWNLSEEGSEELMTSAEGNQIGKSFFFTFCIVIITSIIIFLHHDIIWFFALPLAFAIGVIYPLLLFFLGIFLTKITKKSA